MLVQCDYFPRIKPGAFRLQIGNKQSSYVANGLHEF